MELTPILKDPDAIRTYGIYWGHALVEGDSLAAVSWDVPAGLTKVAEGPNAGPIIDCGTTYPPGTVALLRLSGGIANRNQRCICHIVTANGDEDERTLVISVRER